MGFGFGCCTAPLGSTPTGPGACAPGPGIYEGGIEFHCCSPAEWADVLHRIRYFPGCGTDKRLLSDHLLDRRSSYGACGLISVLASSPSGGSGRLHRILVSAGRGRWNLLLPGSSPARPLDFINSNDSDCIPALTECLHPTQQIFACCCRCLYPTCATGSDRSAARLDPCRPSALEQVHRRAHAGTQIRSRLAQGQASEGVRPKPRSLRPTSPRDTASDAPPSTASSAYAPGA